MNKVPVVSFDEGSINHWSATFKQRRGGLYGFRDAHGHYFVRLSTGKGSEHGLDHQVEFDLTLDKVKELTAFFHALSMDE